jgi:hypothetical protein
MNVQRQRLESALQQCEEHQRLHELSARHFTRINRSLSVVVATLAVCASLLMFLTGFQLEPVRWMQLLAACLSLAAAGITAAPMLLGETDRVERHCAASARYAEMRRELSRLVAIPHVGTDGHVADACDRLTSFNVRSPNIPLSVIKRAKRERMAHSSKASGHPMDKRGDRVA